MRILQALAYPASTRGATRQALILARELQRRGHAVTCALPDAGAAVDRGELCSQALREEGIAVARIEMTGRRGLRELRRLLAEQAFDIVHTHNRDVALRRVLLASIGRRPPALITSWGNVYPIDRRRWLSTGYRERGLRRSHSAWTGAALRSRRVAGIVAVSEAVKRVVVEGAGVVPAKVEVVYEGIDPEQFHPRVRGDGVRRELGLDPHAPVVGIISAHYWVKDFPTFLRAAGLIAKERPDVRFVVAGEGTERVREELGDHPAIADRVAIAGARQDVPALIACLDVVVSTSIYEALGGVLREALAMATPVVCTDVGGNSELVVPERTGLLAPPRDPGAVAAAVLRTVADPQGARRMAERGRELVLRRHTTRARTEAVEAIYREAVARHSAQAPSDLATRPAQISGESATQESSEAGRSRATRVATFHQRRAG